MARRNSTRPQTAKIFKLEVPKEFIEFTDEDWDRWEWLREATEPLAGLNAKQLKAHPLMAQVFGDFENIKKDIYFIQNDDPQFPPKERGSVQSVPCGVAMSNIMSKRWAAQLQHNLKRSPKTASFATPKRLIIKEPDWKAKYEELRKEYVEVKEQLDLYEQAWEDRDQLYAQLGELLK